MNEKQAGRIRNGKGFLAALDQSGGSTPKALELYGIPHSAYTGEKEMFDLVHQMRTRSKSPTLVEYILGAVLFEQTMDRNVLTGYRRGLPVDKRRCYVSQGGKGLAARRRRAANEAIAAYGLNARSRNIFNQNALRDQECESGRHPPDCRSAI